MAERLVHHLHERGTDGPRGAAVRLGQIHVQRDVGMRRGIGEMPLLESDACILGGTGGNGQDNRHGSRQVLSSHKFTYYQF